MAKSITVKLYFIERANINSYTINDALNLDDGGFSESMPIKTF